MNLPILRYFHPVLPSRGLRRVPVSVQIGGLKYVLFRDTAGRAAALDEACPHRRAPLSIGRVRPDGRLACAYHGWNFDGGGRGRSPSCPELTNLGTRAYQVVERWGYLWLAQLETPLSAFPDLGWEGFDFAGCISRLVQAPLEVTLDNISEDEHFPFVHRSFGWNQAGCSEVSVETATFADRSEVRYQGPQRRSPWAPLGGVRTGDLFHNQWSTRFDPVRTVYSFGWRDAKSGCERPIITRPAVFLVPETATRTRIQMLLFLRIGPSLQRWLRPLMHALARHISSIELTRDVQLIEAAATAPSTLQGMRLTRFDRALVHNRRLLQALYWEEAAEQEGLPQPADATARRAVSEIAE